MRKRAALIGRTSGRTGSQEESIETQRHVLEEFAHFLDYEIAGFYLDEGVRSAVPVDERPEGHRLFEDARFGRFDVVLVYRIDRISRYREVFYRFLQQLKDLDIGLRSRHDSFETESPQGRLMLNILLDFAEFERDSIVQRSMDGRARTASLGAHLGGMPPYGYRVEGHKPRYLVAHETTEDGFAEAEIVRLMFGMAALKGLPPLRIAQQINAMGVPLPSAASCRWRRRRGDEQRHLAAFKHDWTLTTVSKMLRDPLYKGERSYTLLGRSYEQQVPPLVDPEVWDEARRQVVARRLHHGPSSRRQYLLSGKIRCGGLTPGGVCSHAWSGATTRANYVRQSDGGRAPDRTDYVCLAVQAQHACGAKFKCGMPRVRAQWVEADLWEKLVERLEDIPTTLLMLEESRGSAQDTRAALVVQRDAVLAQRDTLNTEKRNTARLMAQGILTDAEGAELLQELRLKIENVDRTIAELAREENGLSKRDEQAARAQANIERWRALIRGPLTFADKRAAIVDLVDEIRMVRTPEGVRARYYFVFDPPASNCGPEGTRRATICINGDLLRAIGYG